MLNLKHTRSQAFQDYQDFLSLVRENSNKTYIAVDGFPRSGTNYIRAVCKSKIVDKDIIGDTYLHFLQDYELIDKVIHNQNVIHIFPIRKNIIDVMLSNIVLTKGTNSYIADIDPVVFSVLNYTQKTIEICLSGISNLYFVDIDQPSGVQNSLNQILSSNGIMHDDADIEKIISKLSEEDSANENIVTNRVPTLINGKKDALSEANILLLQDKFSSQLRQVIELYSELLDRIGLR